MGKEAGKVKPSARFAICRILRLIIAEYQQILYVEFGKWRYSAIIIPAFDEIDDVDDIDDPRTQDLRARVRSWQEAPFPHKYPPGPRAPSGGGSSASSISSVRRGSPPGEAIPPTPDGRPKDETTQGQKVAPPPPTGEEARSFRRYVLLSFRRGSPERERIRRTADSGGRSGGADKVRALTTFGHTPLIFWD